MTEADPNAAVTPPAVPPAPVVSAPAPAPKPEPAPAPSAKVKSEAAHYARHPEEFEAVLKELEQAGVVDIRREIAEMKRKDFVRDVIDEIGLSKEDAAFITGSTPDQIKASAAAYKARLDLYATRAGAKPPEAEIEVIPASAFGQPIKPIDNTRQHLPVMPEKAKAGTPSVDQALADLNEAAKGRTYV